MEKLWRYAVAGNIKKTRIDENGVLRYGTSAFKGNTSDLKRNIINSFIKQVYSICQYGNRSRSQSRLEKV